MINFPVSPVLNQEYSFSGKTWKWSGEAWELNSIVPSIGFTGSRGTTGFTGSNGSDGYQGSVGFTGSQGDGFTGSQGSIGFTGSQGLGFTGSQGSVGFTGSKGIDGAAAVGGANTQIIFNDSGVLGASSNFTFDKLTNIFAVNGNISTTETWNSGATAFTHIKSNVTDTASTAGSSLMDLQVGGLTRFKLEKSGRVGLQGTMVDGSSYMNLTPSAFNLNLQAYSGSGYDFNTHAGFRTPSGIAFGTNFTNVVRLEKDADNILAQRNGANAQTSRLYGIYTDGSNYERGYFTSDVNGLTIGHEALGTGTKRPVRMAGPSFYLGGPDTAGATSVVTFSSTTDLVTWNNHGLVTGSPVSFVNSGGALPVCVPSIYANLTYYVVVNDANTFKIATTYVNATDAVPNTIDMQNVGSGTTTARGSRIVQSLSVQNFTGTDVVGAPFIINGSQGTGTGPGGSIVFRAAISGTNGTNGTTGSTANTLRDLMVLNATERAVDIYAGPGGDSQPAFRIYNAAGSLSTYMSSNGVMTNGQLTTSYLGANVSFGLGVTAANAGINWYDTYVHREGLGILGQRAGVNAQTYRLYNTYTDVSNYERAIFGWTSNVLQIGTEAAGTGTRRPINLNYTTTIDGGSRTNVPALTITNIGAGNGGLEVGALQVGHSQDNARMATIYVANKGHTYGHGGSGVANQGIHRFQTDNNGGTSSGAGGSIVDILAPSTATNIFQCRQVDGTVTLNAAYNGALTLGSPTGYAEIDGLSAGAGRELLLGNSVVRAVGLRGNLFVTGSYVSMYNNIPLTWSSDPRLSVGDLIILRDAANTLAQRNGTTAQTSRIYNTYTDASNYERAKIGWNTNVLEIGTENAGTGTLRNINLVGGNVGVGITPTAKLHVNGRIRVDKPYYEPGVSVYHDGTTSGGGPAILIEQSSGSGGYAGIHIKRGRTDSTGLITFGSTQDTGLTYPEWFAGITGNPGIGPDSQFRIGRGSSTSFGSNGNGQTLTYDLVISSTGNVGIGPNNPTAKLDIVETWNNVATTFTHIKSNVTDTASASGSLLMDLQVGGVSKFSVTKGGAATFSGSGGTMTINPATGLDVGTFALLRIGAAQFGPSSDTILVRDAGHTLAQRNGTNAQVYRLYGTYTDAANYERGFVMADADGLTIGHQALGTGVKRPVRIVGPALASAEAVSTLDMSQTWNTTGTPTAVKLNVTDTASNAASLLMDLQVGGSSKFKIDKTGNLTFSTVGSSSVQNITGGSNFSIYASGSVMFNRSIGNYGATVDHASSRVVLYQNYSLQFATGNSAPDITLVRDAASILAQRSGTVAQTSRIYGTFTDASNYERGYLTTDTNGLTIGHEALGTGSGRAVSLRTGSGRYLALSNATTLDTNAVYTRFYAAGVVIANLNMDTKRFVMGADGSYAFSVGADSFNTAVDLVIARDAANTLAQRNGTAAQISRIYNTFTDASNYERAKIGWNTNVLEIGVEAAGTGTLRTTNLIGGNVGIGVAAPSAKLDVGGDIEINSNVNLNSEATTLATVTKTQVASFPVASFRSGKLMVQAYDSVTGEVQISELLVAHNGTTASGTEYGVVFTGASSIVTYDVDISAGNVRLMATRTTANSTQYKISETLMVA